MLPPPAEKRQNFFGVFLQFHIGVDSDEAKAGRWMFDDILSYCREAGIIDDYDSNMLEAIFDGLTKKEDDDE